MTRIPLQIDLRPALPEVLNNADYRQRESELLRIDEILRKSGIEADFESAHMAKWLAGRDEGEISAKSMERRRRRSRRALRCVVLMSLLGEPYREMSVRLAECPLYQWFCELDRVDSIRVPSKSELGRLVEIVEESVLRRVNEALVGMAARAPEAGSAQVLGLKREIDLEAIWMDSTALKANIHFPVDWVLLKDATVTLMKATELIRREGIRHRMAEPRGFIKRMNGLSMEMAAARRHPQSVRRRKKVFRAMKRLVKTVRNHALRHRDLLEDRWQETDWSQAQAQQVIGRVDKVLLRLPQAVEQAHERIIRGNTVENARKMLSLHEDDVHVIVRGKASAEIEFGNSLLLAEQQDGIIIDWKLHKDIAPNDSRQARESMERINGVHGEATVKAVVGDRQFESRANGKWLEEQKIYNALCPRSPEALRDKSKSAKYQKLQVRRAQTEARIAILKNGFIGNPVKRRGFANRELQVAWSVIAHNLWTLARLAVAEASSDAPPMAA